MPLIVVRDAKMKRERILNTDRIFECRQEGELVRIKYSEGGEMRDSAYVEGTVAEFAKQVGAVRVGA